MDLEVHKIRIVIADQLKEKARSLLRQIPMANSMTSNGGQIVATPNFRQTQIIQPTRNLIQMNPGASFYFLVLW